MLFRRASERTKTWQVTRQENGRNERSDESQVTIQAATGSGRHSVHVRILELPKGSLMERANARPVGIDRNIDKGEKHARGQKNRRIRNFRERRAPTGRLTPSSRPVSLRQRSPHFFPRISARRRLVRRKRRKRPREQQPAPVPARWSVARWDYLPASARWLCLV